ncbi:CLUMA_CG013934, isoform A [Clunio marinus]|uniref:CLUMA_CG013934, isoform A n=1 Tax=Clunio marinus TaxID=568069 RepID=A0A1J1ILP4_9DIPT|nr:CLUMA_CG013934, isoform A [Clunio marinus]
MRRVATGTYQVFTRLFQITQHVIEVEYKNHNARKRREKKAQTNFQIYLCRYYCSPRVVLGLAALPPSTSFGPLEDAKQFMQSINKH